MSDASKPPGDRRSYDSLVETRDIVPAVGGNIRSPTAYSPTLAGSGTHEPPAVVGDEAARHTHDEQLIGQLIGKRYRIIGWIGRGGMAVVYEAHDITLNRRVAFKIMDLAQIPEAARGQRSLSEAQSQGQHTHPNIVAVFDVGAMTDGPFAGFPFIVMEHVEGVNLDVFIQSGGLAELSFVDAVSIAEQILLALEAAHAKRIIHRDLKPDNVFLQISERRGRKMYRAKVGDFGLAKQEGKSSGMTGTVVGTPMYMSPEQASGIPLDARSDLYSAGLILYHLFSGGPHAYETYVRSITDPRTGDSNVSLMMSAHHQQRPEDPRRHRPELSDELVAFLLTALSKNPDQRFQSAEDMLEAFRHAAGTGVALSPSFSGVEGVEPVIPLTRIKTPDRELPAASLPPAASELSGTARRPMRFVVGVLLATACGVVYAGYRLMSPDSAPAVTAPRARVAQPQPLATPTPATPVEPTPVSPSRARNAVAVSPAPSESSVAELRERIEKLKKVCGPDLKRRRLTRSQRASCREYAKLQRQYADALRAATTR